MSKSYFELYKHAKELLDKNQVVLEGVKTNEDWDKYFFKVNDYDTTLTITKAGLLWKRSWLCSCKHYSLFGERTECKHVVAAVGFLINGGIPNGKTKED